MASQWRNRPLRCLAGAAVALSAVLGASPAYAAPSPEDVRAERERAEQLADQAEMRAAETTAARARLSGLSAAAGRALGRFVLARDEALAARAEEKHQRDLLESARAGLDAQRRSLGSYAAAAYRNGGAVGELATAASLLESRNVTDLGRGVAMIRWAGDRKSVAVDRVEDAAARQAQAAVAAAAAQKRAEAAERRSRAAKKDADRLVAEQTEVLRATESALVDSVDSAAAAQARAEDMQRALEEAQRVAAERAAEAEHERLLAIERGEVVLGRVDIPDGGCAGADVSSYPNGQLPRPALCPLWGADWHVLRADAAAAFNAMSKDYARTFRRPICVTDSYRSYAMQVDVHRRKPDMTAKPGTSNHGWGLAVDLCDGVNEWDTATHRWMQDNAPRFGWFHPGWAVRGGSRPEPWHWEFAPEQA